MSIDFSKLSSAVDEGYNKVKDSRDLGLNTLRKVRTRNSSSSKPAKPVKTRPFNKVKDSISYLSLKKRIKDALSETETTDEAIQAIEQIAQDKPADVVIPAVVEVLGETIDILESAIDSSSISVSTDFDEDGIDDKTELESDIEPEDELESEISDSDEYTSIIRQAYQRLPFNKRHLDYKQLESDGANYYVTFMDLGPTLPGEEQEKYVVNIPIASHETSVSDFSIGDYYESEDIEGVITGIEYTDNGVTLLVDVQDELGNISPTEVNILC